MPELLTKKFFAVDRHRQSELALRVRALADQAFSRAAGAPLIEKNAVRLLRNAEENYPAWLEAIRGAQRHVHFENYIIHDDAAGEMFAAALIERARAGVTVRVIYDWLGCFSTSRTFWGRLRAAGVEVRCYNPPRLDSPLGWLSRDHRKQLVVDGSVGFVAGLCVGQMWVGYPEKKIEAWRDTGVEIRGAAVADLEHAFATVWSMLGESIPANDDALAAPEPPCPAGEISVRIVATEPATSRTFRLDQLVAAFARKRVWLTDAYYVGTSTYVQGLTTAARQGVDVRILLPGVSDLPMVRSLSRSGYRPLLEAGVRIFEWNGVMLHAKSAVVDGRWSRVGSTNLNMASWLGNCEMDAVIEDEPFARQMEALYEQDLSNSTEIVLTEKRRVRAPHPLPHTRGSAHPRGSARRAAVGAVRIGHALGAAIADRRTIEPLESRLMVMTGLVLLALAVAFAFFPAALAYPSVVIIAWFALSLLYRGWKARRNNNRREPPVSPASNT
jgi:cardiolipin synthase